MAKLMTANDVLEIFPVSQMALWRWENDPDCNFPKPIRIKARRYWREDEIMAFLDRQAA